MDPFNVMLRVAEAMFWVAGSGHGKTQLLQQLILYDLEMVQAGEASLIVIDSQGDMLGHIRSLSAVGQMADRVVLIDPVIDIQSPPALNLFDFGLERVDRYTEVERETLINGAIALYEYVFGALLGAELTNRGYLPLPCPPYDDSARTSIRLWSLWITQIR